MGVLLIPKFASEPSREVWRTPESGHQCILGITGGTGISRAQRLPKGVSRFADFQRAAITCAEAVEKTGALLTLGHTYRKVPASRGVGV